MSPSGRCWPLRPNAGTISASQNDGLRDEIVVYFAKAGYGRVDCRVDACWADRVCEVLEVVAGNRRRGRSGGRG
jgi:hypothetical protein